MRVFLRIKDTELFLKINEISKIPQFTLLKYASNFDKVQDKEFINSIINDFKNQKVAELEVIENI